MRRKPVREPLVFPSVLAALVILALVACVPREPAGGAGHAGGAASAGGRAGTGGAGVPGTGGSVSGGGASGTGGSGSGGSVSTGGTNEGGSGGPPSTGGASATGGASTGGGAGGFGGPGRGGAVATGGDRPDASAGTNGSMDAGPGDTTDGAVLPPGPAAVSPVPTVDQVAWQRLGLTAFFHFGMNTFTGDEAGDGNASASTFNPTGLDPKQWVSTLQAAGFKLGILVAKHHDGFCLWPTKCSSYNVSSSSWMGGKGDVVKAYADAAHAAGFRVGIYLSPLDSHAADSSSAADYPTKFNCMVDELLKNYGTVDELWFDGNKAPNLDWGGIASRAKQIQPHVLVAIKGPDIRWVGTESGVAPAGETSVKTGDTTLGQKSGPVWYPSESDTSIRPGWFYHASEDGQVRSVTDLTDTYFNTVGRNSLLLLNVPPNQVGVLAGADVNRLNQFGSSLKTTFTTNLALGKTATGDSVFEAQSYAAAKAVDGNLESYWAAGAGKTTGRLEVDLGAARSIKIVDIAEPIAVGERSSRYHVEVQAAGATTWTTIGSGTVIGARNLIRLTTAVTAQKIALVIETARGVPAIAEFGAY